MEDEEKKAVLELYPEFHTLYGPYVRKDSRKIVILYDGTRRSARQLAKVRLEVKLGRRLIGSETVDHSNLDCSDDGSANLRVLSRSENASNSAFKLDTGCLSAVCLFCEKPFVLSRYQHNTRALSKDGPFCSRSCAGKYAHTVKEKTRSKVRAVVKRYYR